MLLKFGNDRVLLKKNLGSGLRQAWSTRISTNNVLEEMFNGSMKSWTDTDYRYSVKFMYT